MADYGERKFSTLESRTCVIIFFFGSVVFSMLVSLQSKRCCKSVVVRYAAKSNKAESGL